MGADREGACARCHGGGGGGDARISDETEASASLAPDTKVNSETVPIVDCGVEFCLACIALRRSEMPTARADLTSIALPDPANKDAVRGRG